MPGLTYAKAGGPPNNLDGLEVIDNATGRRVTNVLEVNTMEGWVRLFQRNDVGNLMVSAEGDSLVEGTITGSFRLVDRRR